MRARLETDFQGDTSTTCSGTLATNVTLMAACDIDEVAVEPPGHFGVFRTISPPAYRTRQHGALSVASLGSTSKPKPLVVVSSATVSDSFDN